MCRVLHLLPLLLFALICIHARAAAPIAVQDIPARALEEQQRIDLVRQQLAAGAPVVRLTRELDDIAQPVTAKQHGAAANRLDSLPVMRLESLARHWDFDARRIARWEEDARRAFAPYEQSAVQLAQRRAAWIATRDAGLLATLPQPLAERVEKMLAEIDAGQAALGLVLRQQFALTQRADELKAGIRAGQREAAMAIDELDRRLLRRELPPLWQASQEAAHPQTALGALRRGLDIEVEFARDYNAADTGNQRAVRLVQVLLAPLIGALVLRSRRLRQPGAAVPLALRRPVSLWLLLAMSAVLLLEADAPVLLQELALLALLVPVLRLMPSALARSLGVWPYAASALYCLDRIGVTAIADAATYRWYLLVLNGLALALTVWLLRRPLPALPAGPLAGAERPLVWMVLGALLVAAACNIAGNVSLAGALTSGVIDSGYLALVLYASVAACSALLRALLRDSGLARQPFLQREGRLLEALVTRVVILCAAIGWLLYTLDRFRLLRPVREALASLMAAGFSAGEVSLQVGDVLLFLLCAWLAWGAARTVRRILREELRGRATLPRGAGNSIASLSYYAVLLLGLLIALSAAGFKVSQLALVFGPLGVGIGFGLQNVVNNFVCGLVLMVERPIQPGDVIDAAGISGTVRDIGLRATTIRTFDGADAVVPNGLLLSGNLSNWTMFDRDRRFEVKLNVAYGSDPAQVVAVVGAAARATAGVKDEPGPQVLLSSYGDSALGFTVRAWTSDASGWLEVRANLLAGILAALREAGVQIPYPRVDVSLREPAPPY